VWTLLLLESPGNLSVDQPLCGVQLLACFFADALFNGARISLFDRFDAANRGLLPSARTTPGRKPAETGQTSGHPSAMLTDKLQGYVDCSATRACGRPAALLRL